MSEKETKQLLLSVMDDIDKAISEWCATCCKSCEQCAFENVCNEFNKLEKKYYLNAE